MARKYYQTKLIIKKIEAVLIIRVIACVIKSI